MPPTDNSHHLRQAAARRHKEARERATKVLRAVAKTGRSVSFRAVAADAAVSTSWLYTQPDIRSEIERLRALSNRSRGNPVAAADRTSAASSIRRIESLTDDNHRLRKLVQDLRAELTQKNEELAIVHGQLRSARTSVARS